MHILEQQRNVIRGLAENDGRDMQIVDGRMYEISVRPVAEDTVKEAVKRVLEGKENASTSD